MTGTSFDVPQGQFFLSKAIFMRRFSSLLFFLAVMPQTIRAQSPWAAEPELVDQLSKQKEFNYVESNVPAFTLPNPLQAANGSLVNSASDWPALRQQTLQLFRDNVYGRRPELSYEVEFKVVAEKSDLLDIGATGRHVSVIIKQGVQSYSFPIYMFLPKVAGDEKNPAILAINNREFPTFESAIETDDEFWPVKDILSRGYVACAVSTHTIDPDEAGGFDRGIRGFFHRNSHASSAPSPDAWKALSAWGWGASRALDYLLTLDQVDGAKIAVLGHSRGGKTALWAAAEDARFSIAFSNNSGCGGAALSRRQYGETVKRITTAFPHWFCDTFATYGDRESELPIDQHQLLGLIAPRALYVTSAAEDLWADPRGEYLSVIAAAPVFSILGKDSIQDEQMAVLDVPRIEGVTGYHIRTGKHDLNRYDWTQFLNFCDTQWLR